MSAVVAFAIEDHTGVIELNRPEKFNCLSVKAHQEIDKAREKFEADQNVRSILIRARGKHFCTGADLDEVTEVIKDHAALDHFIAFGMIVLQRLETSPLPVVAAVQGLCLAGGMELMLAADVCFAGQSARVGDQHAQFGLIPGWGGSQRLTRLLGMRRALDLMFSARWLDATEAHAMGLVNYITPDEMLHEQAAEYCRTLATRSRSGLAEMKRLARQGIELPLAQSMRLERDAVVRHLESNDSVEGLQAFRDCRRPNFT
ncbi:MAG: enoyl-CoA hydratase/isomerase family protein [Pseudorhodoplanes sp.]|jgi:enoyl-CoA hydratase/carnithine racemase|nr:enoyl-CoA hydratase/isomerase family protein [Pseudorhodoplanes sp.]